MNNFALVMIGVLTNAGAQLLLKLGMNAVGKFEFTGAELARVAPAIFTSPSILLGLASYVASFLVWLAVLSRMDVSLAYPMISIGYTIGLAGGYYFFKEPVTTTRILGVAVIMLGVLLISRK